MRPGIAAACGGGPQCHDDCPAAQALECVGAKVKICTPDVAGCLNWSVPTTCGGSRFCEGATNTCVTCTPQCNAVGSTQCSGAQLQTCGVDANGCLALSSADCPAGQACDAAVGHCATVPVVCPAGLLHVTAASSPAGPASDPGSCQRPVRPSALPAAQVQHFGTRTVGETVTFAIPPGTGGFSIVSQAVNASTADLTVHSGSSQFTVPNSVVPLLVKAPDGSIFYDDNAAVPADEARALAAYGGVSPTTGSFTLPNTSAGLAAFAAGVTPGSWSFVVGDFAAECAALGPATCSSGASTTSTYDVSVITRPGPVPAAGRIDLAIYLVTGAFTAAAAVTDPGMARMLSTLALLYSRAGLCLGDVTFHDVSAWAKARYSTGVDAERTGPCDDLDQMFTLSAPGNTLNIFLVDDITQGTGGGVGTVVGIDGTIPGPSSFGGTVHSGAIVNAADLGHGVCGGPPSFLRCGSDGVAYIVAHEGGHWMGLYHTTESLGDSFDPLSDTGTCRCTVCAPAALQAQCSANNPTLQPGQVPTQVTGTSCNKGGACDGAQYLMFWLIDQTSVGSVSTQQGQVVRANPVVQ